MQLAALGELFRFFETYPGTYQDYEITKLSLDWRKGQYQFTGRFYDYRIFDLLSDVTIPADAVETIPLIPDPGTLNGTYTDGTGTDQTANAGIQEIVAYDICFSVEGKPAAGQVIFRFLPKRPCKFLAGLPGSGIASEPETPATAEAIFTLFRGSSLSGALSVGTLTFAASGTVTTAVATSDIEFTQTDIDAEYRLYLVAPDPTASTLADLAGTIKGVKEYSP